jgi:hypothetical protein
LNFIGIDLVYFGVAIGLYAEMTKDSKSRKGGSQSRPAGPEQAGYKPATI